MGILSKYDLLGGEQDNVTFLDNKKYSNNMGDIIWIQNMDIYFFNYFYCYSEYISLLFYK